VNEVKGWGIECPVVTNRLNEGGNEGGKGPLNVGMAEKDHCGRRTPTMEKEEDEHGNGR
jgi:hypothetical protein|tara:strand:+ start:96 stop:272 length:177 start_codon:yes stop_codon:yes gene_type:complete